MTWALRSTLLTLCLSKVVTEESAAPILDNTSRSGLRSDHQNMCKFASRNSPGYRLVVSSLRRYSIEAPKSISRRWDQEKALMMSMRRNEAQDLVSTTPKEFPVSADSNSPTQSTRLNPCFTPKYSGSSVGSDDASPTWEEPAQVGRSTTV